MTIAADHPPCEICRGSGADRYRWCRPCIARAARGAARYMARFTATTRYGHDDYGRAANHWQRKFKRRLERR